MSPRQLIERLSNAALRDLLYDKPASSIPRMPPLILLERCPVCHEWLPQGSKQAGQCRACDAWITPLVK